MFSEYLNVIDAEKQTATAQPTPINPDFVSLAELLERVQAAPAKHLSLIDAAKLMMMWGTAKTDKPEWRCNSKTRGIVRVDATQATWATARLEYVSNQGHFESDGGNGASSDYELFGFDRKEYSDFLTLKAGKPLDLFGPMPDPKTDTESEQNAVTTAPKPLQRTAAQDAVILCEIVKQGYDPLALPRNPDGKPGVKAAIRTALLRHALFTGSTIFDKAWERLTAHDDIAIRR